MKAVILCGGQGTRIRDVNETLPKPMLPIGGKPMVWHIMKGYATYGIKNFVLCLGYKGWLIKEFFLNYRAMTADVTVHLDRHAAVEIHDGQSDEDWSVTLAETGEATQTGARVAAIRRYVENDDMFCLTYGDGVSDLNFEQLLAFHKAHGKVATVTAVRPPGRFGEIRADGGGVEKFNDHWQQKFKDRVVMNSEAELRRQSPIFEHRHNTLYRYSPLGGKTPAAALAASGVSLRFAATERAPRHPPPKPEAGRYHLIRFIRSEGILDIFGEKFAAPPEATIHTQVLRRPPVIERERINFE